MHYIVADAVEIYYPAWVNRCKRDGVTIVSTANKVISTGLVELRLNESNSTLDRFLLMLTRIRFAWVLHSQVGNVVTIAITGYMS